MPLPLSTLHRASAGLIAAAALLSCAQPTPAPSAAPPQPASAAPSATAAAQAPAPAPRAPDAIWQGEAQRVVWSRIQDALKQPVPRPGDADTTAHPGPFAAKDVQHLARVQERFALTSGETERLLRDGAVVLPHVTWHNWTLALHDIYQSELPLYLSVDAALHATYASNMHVISGVELDQLMPALTRAIDDAHAHLPEAARAWPADVADDVDLYITVAHALLHDAPPASQRGNDAQAQRLIDAIMAAGAMRDVTLFGRLRSVDWTFYAPRGHYAKTDALSTYFRAATWLSRLEFNLVTRSCQSSAPQDGRCDREQTPREALDALALAQLYHDSGAAADIARVNRAWGLMAGVREDTPTDALHALRTQAGIDDLRAPDAFARFKDALGDRYPRTTRVHYMSEQTTDLPAIATTLGARITPDARALMPLLHPKTDARYLIQAGDVAYALGHDRALAHLAPALKRHPDLRRGLDLARDAVTHDVAKPGARDALYTLWLDAARAHAPRPQGVVPSFMRTPLYDDLRLNSAVATYGHIRHNYVLMAAQVYDAGGCTMPDAYVEPSLPLYDRLIAYNRQLAALSDNLFPDGERADWVHDHAGRSVAILRTLRHVARRQLAGARITPQERAFFNAIVEAREVADEDPEYSGWYLQLFAHNWSLSPEPAYAEPAAMIADVQTSNWTQRIRYVGTAQPRLGVFLINTGGPPRVAVGPVAHAYQHVTPLKRRLDDAQARALPVGALDAPWASSYTAPARRTPPPALAIAADNPPPHGTPNPDHLIRLRLVSKRTLPRVTVTVLDHHRRPMATRTVRVTPRGTRVTIPNTPAAAQAIRDGAVDGGDTRLYTPEGLRIQVGDFVGWAWTDDDPRFAKLTPKTTPAPPSDADAKAWDAYYDQLAKAESFAWHNAAFGGMKRIHFDPKARTR